MYKIILNFTPWIFIRFQLIFLKIIDFVLLTFLNLIFFKGSYNFLDIINSILWIFISYLLGRYHSLLEIKFNYKKYIIKTLLTLTFFILCNWILSQYINTSLESISLIFYIFNSVIFLMICRTVILKLTSHNNKWFYIGKKEIFETIINSSDLENRNYKVINLDVNELISKNKINNKIGIIIESFESINNSDLKKIRKMGFSVISRIDWYQIYLNRYPIDLMDKKDLKIIRKLNINSFLKRITDITFSIFILVLSFPLILILSILIILEDGKSPFYSQERTGFQCSSFKIIKLRTMIKNAEKEGAVWSKNNDNRITSIGKFIRRSRIDEIPQLISVIKGDMSLIGPRPERPEIDKMLSKKIKNYNLRYLSKPGLSGWAQVNYPYGASIKDAKYKLSYDYYYQLNQNFLLDLLIFLKTIKLISNLEGAIAKN